MSKQFYMEEQYYKTQDDLDRLIEALEIKKSVIEEKIPKLSFRFMTLNDKLSSITYEDVNIFFDQEGNSLQGFYMSEKGKMGVKLLRRFIKDARTSNSPNAHEGFSNALGKAFVQLSPDMLTKEELENIRDKKIITREINGKTFLLKCTTGMMPPLFRDMFKENGQTDALDEFEERVKDEYPDLKRRLDEYNSIIADLKKIRPKLPRATREVIIEIPEEENKFGGK